MSALLELAERCEQAAGPDRELSAAIALAVHDYLHEVEGNKPLNCRIRNRFGSSVYIGSSSSNMDYTASLDAAMTLVPEGWDCVIAMGDHASLRRGGKAIRGVAQTTALALCAAALKARGDQ